MNKAEFIELVMAAGDYKTKADATRALDSITAAVKNGLKKHGEVRLVNFGTFAIKRRKARIGRNPQTGDSIKIKASKTVGFKAGKGLKTSV